MARNTTHPSNKLFNGECDDLRDALLTMEQAYRTEAAQMRRICEPGDPFPDELVRDANVISELYVEYCTKIQEAENDLIEKWLQSEDALTLSIAEAASEGDYTALAI